MLLLEVFLKQSMLGEYYHASKNLAQWTPGTEFVTSALFGSLEDVSGNTLAQISLTTRPDTPANAHGILKHAKMDRKP